MKGRVLFRLTPVLALLAGSATPAAGEKAPGVPAFGEQLVQVLGGLAMVLALVVILAWLVRRLNGARFAGARNLRLVAGISLGSRERILVVEVGETQLVVGVAPGRVQTLHVLDQPLAGTAPEQPVEGGSFSGRLAQLMGRGGGS